MKIKSLSLMAATTAAVVATQAVGASSAQAAILGGSHTCEQSTFGYVDCAGAFAGNDKGAKGTGLTNLNALFGGEWSFEGDNESGLVSFGSGGDGTQQGTATTTLSGAGAIAVKAGNSYSLYSVADLSSFSWDTLGVTPVGKKRKKAPGLSHLSIYRQVNGFPEPEPAQEVPEPGIFLGLVGLASMGRKLRRR